MHYLRILRRHACGAGNRLSIYSSTEEVAVYPVPTAKTEGLPGNWEYQGCFALVNCWFLPPPITYLYLRREPAYPLPRTYLHQIVYETDMTAEGCLNRCAEYGYLSAGFEFGKECCELTDESVDFQALTNDNSQTAVIPKMLQHARPWH